MTHLLLYVSEGSFACGGKMCGDVLGSTGDASLSQGTNQTLLLMLFVQFVDG